MRTRSLATLATTLVFAGCYRRAAEPPPLAPPEPALVPVAPAIEDAGWPARLAFQHHEEERVLKRGALAMFTVETRLPQFQSEPPAVAAALNARLARLARPPVGPRTYDGKYTVECSVELANRYAVVLDCSRQLEEYTFDEDTEEEDVSDEHTRVVFGWWLRPGLPRLALEQLAPDFDLDAAIEAEVPSQPTGCDLRACAFASHSFLIDTDGLTPIATEECSHLCEVSIPTVPIDRLAPTHAWAEELVKRIRRRIDAGDTLVEGDLSY